MEAWLQSMAIGVAVLVGLVSPATDLRLDGSALRGQDTVDVQVAVARAVTPEVRDYLLAGNSLVLAFDVQWGPVRLVRTRTIQYRAWEGEFQVKGEEPGDALVTKDAEAAFRAWRTLGRVNLGSFADLQPALGTPLRIRVSLRPGPGTGTPGSVQALWGYKVPEESLVYRSWLEIPR